jgi:endoglucanase
MIKTKLTILAKLAIIGFSILFSFLRFAPAYAATVEVWWPTQEAVIQGVQPFKGLLQGSALSEYSMYWQVDGGQLNLMPDNYQDYPHKEVLVDLSGWNWKGTGPYVLTFVAKDKSGNVVGQTTRTIYTGEKTTTTSTTVTAPTVTNTTTVTASPTLAPTPADYSTPSTGSKKKRTTVVSGSISGGTTTVAPAPAPTPTLTATVVSPSTSNPLAGKTLYVDPNSQAAAAVKSANPTDAALLSKISTSPTAVWLGGWYADSQLREKVASVINGAKTFNATPTFVLYNIPIRDCGSYSAGGANNPEGYKAWINSIADTIGSNSAVVILEPDAVLHTDCLNETEKQTRMSLLNYAITTLKAKGNIAVYLDAGHSGWKSVDEIATLLNNAGIAQAHGFSLNVSNFQTTDSSVNYGKLVSAKVGGKHFVVDTSRNGNGSNGEWCNPSGRALGNKPTTTTGEPLADAFLWIKAPGESDGQCNGGPSAGTWWAQYALGLATLARW